MSKLPPAGATGLGEPVTENEKTIPASDNETEGLRNLTSAQFAALGDNSIVYRRMVLGRDLARLLGQAPHQPASVPADVPVHVVFGASGRPLMVTDDVGGMGEWLSEAELTLISRH
jgi:hypothetical protein